MFNSIAPYLAACIQLRDMEVCVLTFRLVEVQLEVRGFLFGLLILDVWHTLVQVTRTFTIQFNITHLSNLLLTLIHKSELLDFWRWFTETLLRRIFMLLFLRRRLLRWLEHLATCGDERVQHVWKAARGISYDVPAIFLISFRGLISHNLTISIRSTFRVTFFNCYRLWVVALSLNLF